MRVGLWLATTSLSMTSVVPAMAQPAPPPGAEQAGEVNIDPPALVGRLAAMAGSVSFHSSGETKWNPATLNYPVTSGLSFWTEPQASATLEIADDRVVLDESTELDVGTLDQSQFATTEPQGAVFLQLSNLPQGQSVTIMTPRGAVQISATGRYEIVAGDANDATTVSVVEGAAHVEGTNLSLDIGPQQTATISGTDALQGSVGPLQQDAFLQAQLQMQAPRREATVVPPQVQYMTGGVELQQYGSWTDNSAYGQVWYPSGVASNWAPYRDGHWAYVQPWGWTWVDNARWGFAPFHYGRWVQVNDRWGWVAGEGGAIGVGWPVYSPALVTFLDVGGAALAGAAIGFGVGELVGGYAPAWIPLGPREPYYPWYHTRGDYFERINRPYGVPQDILRRGPTYINNVTINHLTYINRRAATVVPAGAFARGEAVGHFGRPLPERALMEARPVVGRLALRPTAFTPNLAPAAARHFGVTPAASAARVAAGPRIEAAPARAHAMPELRRAAAPGNIRAVPAGVAAQSAGRPGVDHSEVPAVHGPEGRASVLPPLRAPGARPEAMPSTGSERSGLARERGLPGAGEAERRAVPSVHQPTGAVAEHGREARPAVGPSRAEPERRPEVASPHTGRPALGRPETPRAAPAHVEERHELPRPQARPEMPRVEEPHPAPRPERRREPEPRPAAAAHEAAPHPAAPHPAPRPEKRPEPR